nr:hypothetical protein GCM10025732_35180 [Glycomyces mayteni]
MRPTTAAALAGTACAAVALATAQLAAAAVAPGSAPVAAIGAAVVDAVPEPVKEFAIRTFGEHDKLALLAGIGTALAVLAAATGVAARRRPWIGYAVLALLGGAGAAAALARPAASPSWAVPSLVGAACGAGVLAMLLRERLEGPAAPGRAVDRRGVLIALGGAGLAGAAGWRLTGTSDLEDARDAIDLPAPVDVGPAGTGLADAAEIDGLTPYLTPSADFYRVDTALVLPRVLPEDYTLRITGRVANPSNCPTGTSSTAAWSNARSRSPASPTRSAGTSPGTRAGSACPSRTSSPRPGPNPARTRWSRARPTAGPRAPRPRPARTGATRSWPSA